MCSVTEGSWVCTNRRWVSEQKGAGGRLRIGSGGRTTVRPETRRALISLGLRMGQWVAFLAPVLGLFVFWLLAFRPAVTLYALIVGLGIVLLKLVELRRLSFEIKDIARRKVHDYYTH